MSTAYAVYVMSVLRNCKSVRLNGGVVLMPPTLCFMARLTTPMIRSATRRGMQMNEPPPYLGSFGLPNLGSVSMFSTSTGSPSCTALPDTPSPTRTSGPPRTSVEWPRAATTFSVCRSRSRSMIEPIRAWTARIVRSRTSASRSWMWGIFEAISTISFRVPSLNTRSSRRSVEARRSASMRLNALASSLISTTGPSPATAP